MTPWSNPLGISPDGTQVIFLAFDSNWGSRLFIRAIGDPDVREVSGSETSVMPFFSWDGSFVAYSSGNELWRARLSGGAAEKISDVPLLKAGAAWGPDNTIVFSWDGSLRKLLPNGGPSDPLGSLEPGELRHDWPQFLPDGETLLFTIETPDGFRPAILSMTTGEHRVLGELGLGRGARYVASGHIVLAARNQLLAAAFDLPRLEVSSRPVPVLDGVFVELSSGLAWFTTSESSTGAKS